VACVTVGAIAGTVIGDLLGLKAEAELKALAPEPEPAEAAP